MKRKCEHAKGNFVCDDCAMLALAAQQAVCDAEQKMLRVKLAEHLREACPYAERGLACECHGRIPGSLAAYEAASYEGWTLDAPSKEEKLADPPEPPPMRSVNSVSVIRASVARMPRT